MNFEKYSLYIFDITITYVEKKVNSKIEKNSKMEKDEYDKYNKNLRKLSYSKSRACYKRKN